MTPEQHKVLINQLRSLLAGAEAATTERALLESIMKINTFAGFCCTLLAAAPKPMFEGCTVTNLTNGIPTGTVPRP